MLLALPQPSPSVLRAEQAITLGLSAATCVYEGWARAAVHDGIFKSNFAAGKRRENSSVAFGKVAVGNELLRNAFFRE